MKKNTIQFSVFTIISMVLFVSNIVLGQHKESSITLALSEKKIEKKIDSVLSLLTLEEKVGLCHAQSKFSVSGVERLGIPELHLSDGPHGIRAEIQWDSWNYAGWTNDSITAFPALTCLASTFNPELASQYGLSLGEEARYRKKEVLLGPGVNIYRTPLNGRNFEYMGEDPYLAAQMVVPFISGVQKNGVAACLKHFALNNQEKWRNHINVELSERALREIYLPAFKAGVQEGRAWSVMGAYNKIRTYYSSENDMLLNKILKSEWGFDGVVISDWGSAHSTFGAALNGLDIEMGTGTGLPEETTNNYYGKYYLASPFIKLLKNGSIKEEVLDEKVRRILRLIYRTSLRPNPSLGRKNTIAHHQIARKVATEGIVLLKNKNNFFPIADSKGITIAVIGENATKMMTLGGGSSELKVQFEISPLQGLKERYREATIKYTKGYSSTNQNADSLEIAAIELAKKADVVLFIGGLNKNLYQDSEGDDRKKYGLPYNQPALINQLLQVNKNVGIILVSGNAVEMPWVEKVQGVVQAWYLGSMTGLALADIISGDKNPSGKLPFSFPVKLHDNAAISFGTISYPGDSINQQYKEDILVGYRWFDTKKIKPLFAFGYGLSYTTFKLSSIKMDKSVYTTKNQINVSFQISNTGNISGAETIQIYVGKPKSKVKRALKELKGFKKINVEKGDTKKVQIPIDVDKLAYYDEGLEKWAIEKGTYSIYVGTSSDKIIKKIKIKVE